jgi:hypothetical protein
MTEWMNHPVTVATSCCLMRVTTAQSGWAYVGVDEGRGCQTAFSAT